MDPTVFATLLANASQTPAPAAPPRPVAPDDLGTALANSPVEQHSAILSSWEAAGWDCSRFRVAIPAPAVEQAVPIKWPAAEPAPVEDPEAELTRLLAQNTSATASPVKPKRGRPAKVESSARFELACACASGGLSLEAFRAYAAEVLS